MAGDFEKAEESGWALQGHVSRRLTSDTVNPPIACEQRLVARRASKSVTSGWQHPSKSADTGVRRTRL